jgi:hypothetical protein
VNNCLGKYSEPEKRIASAAARAGLEKQRIRRQHPGNDYVTSRGGIALALAWGFGGRSIAAMARYGVLVVGGLLLVSMAASASPASGARQRLTVTERNYRLVAPGLHSCTPGS